LILKRHTFENRHSLAQKLAGRVALALSRAISRQGSAVLAVSGGSTPALFFDELSRESISWEKVVISLVDERQVDETSPRSNARLVKAALLQNQAKAARFVPLFQNQSEAEKLSLDVVVLGMGEDGHTASFFPGGNTLADAVMEIEAPGAGEPRLTFTLPALMKAKVLCLHIEGDKKQAVLETAIAGTDVLAMPIRAVLQADTPLEIFCCP
jgi:6-phosphogluconolactonase